MEVAVISDIHSNIVAFEAVLEQIETNHIICGGDLTGYNPWPNEVVEIMQKLKIPCVMGNHDYGVVSGEIYRFNPLAAAAIKWTQRELTPENLDYLKSLPQKARFKFGDREIFVVHGSPRSPIWEYVMLGTPEPVLKEFVEKAGHPDVLVLGHTHVPLEDAAYKTRILNPGSVGQPRDGDPRAAYMTISFKEGNIEYEQHKVEYEIDKVTRKVREAGLPPDLGTRLYYGW